MFYECEDLKGNEILLKLNHTCQEQPEKQWLPTYYFDICLLDGTVIGYYYYLCSRKFSIIKNM